MSHYIFTTTANFSKTKSKQINRAIKKIDETAEFVGPLSIPGCKTTGWIERPNDGTNNQNEVSSRNQDMAEIARNAIYNDQEKSK